MRPCRAPSMRWPRTRPGRWPRSTAPGRRLDHGCGSWPGGSVEKNRSRLSGKVGLRSWVSALTRACGHGGGRGSIRDRSRRKLWTPASSSTDSTPVLHAHAKRMQPSRPVTRGRCGRDPAVTNDQGLSWADPGRPAPSDPGRAVVEECRRTTSEGVLRSAWSRRPPDNAVADHRTPDARLGPEPDRQQPAQDRLDARRGRCAAAASHARRRRDDLRRPQVGLASQISLDRPAASRGRDADRAGLRSGGRPALTALLSSCSTGDAGPEPVRQCRHPFGRSYRRHQSGPALRPRGRPSPSASGGLL